MARNLRGRPVVADEKGRRGATGATGERGARGEKGAKGEKGATGRRGIAGPRGPVGPSVSRAQMLAAVAEHFVEVNQRLETQLIRIAQLQEQLDRQQKDIGETRDDLSHIRNVI